MAPTDSSDTLQKIAWRIGMFANALERAMGFTRAVVVSKIQHNGQCSASLGAFVVVNPEGWIVTASHIVQNVLALDREVVASRKVSADRMAIEADVALSNKERRRSIAQLPKIHPRSAAHFSPFWSLPGVRIKDMSFIAGIDIAVGRLEPFDPTWFADYPVFKDPTKNIRPGKSLCRLGFPFHSFTPTFDTATNQFTLPPEAMPVPIFASDGIISRFLDVTGAGLPVAPTYRLRWIETSSPGLKGQSGGPLVDEKGSIWGIQSNTFSYELGFTPKVANGKKNQTEHQFLNAGRAVHPETIVG